MKSTPESCKRERHILYSARDTETVSTNDFIFKPRPSILNLPRSSQLYEKVVSAQNHRYTNENDEGIAARLSMWFNDDDDGDEDAKKAPVGRISDVSVRDSLNQNDPVSPSIGPCANLISNMKGCSSMRELMELRQLQDLKHRDSCSFNSSFIQKQYLVSSVVEVEDLRNSLDMGLQIGGLKQAKKKKGGLDFDSENVVNYTNMKRRIVYAFRFPVFSEDLVPCGKTVNSVLDDNSNKNSYCFGYNVGCGEKELMVTMSLTETSLISSTDWFNTFPTRVYDDFPIELPNSYCRSSKYEHRRLELNYCYKCVLHRIMSGDEEYKCKLMELLLYPYGIKYEDFLLMNGPIDDAIRNMGVNNSQPGAEVDAQSENMGVNAQVHEISNMSYGWMWYAFLNSVSANSLMNASSGWRQTDATAASMDSFVENLRTVSKQQCRLYSSLACPKYRSELGDSVALLESPALTQVSGYYWSEEYLMLTRRGTVYQGSDPSAPDAVSEFDVVLMRPSAATSKSWLGGTGCSNNNHDHSKQSLINWKQKRSTKDSSTRSGKPTCSHRMYSISLSEILEVVPLYTADEQIPCQGLSEKMCVSNRNDISTLNMGLCGYGCFGAHFLIVTFTKVHRVLVRSVKIRNKWVDTIRALLKARQHSPQKVHRYGSLDQQLHLTAIPHGWYQYFHTTASDGDAASASTTRGSSGGYPLGAEGDAHASNLRVILNNRSYYYGARHTDPLIVLQRRIKSILLLDSDHGATEKEMNTEGDSDGTLDVCGYVESLLSLLYKILSCVNYESEHPDIVSMAVSSDSNSNSTSVLSQYHESVYSKNRAVSVNTMSGKIDQLRGLSGSATEPTHVISQGVADATTCSHSDANISPYSIMDATDLRLMTFLDGVAGLQNIDLKGAYPANSREMLCVLTNMYHMLLLHTLLLYRLSDYGQQSTMKRWEEKDLKMGFGSAAGEPVVRGALKWIDFHRVFSYEAFGDVWSLCEHEHNILRYGLVRPDIGWIAKKILIPKNQYDFSIKPEDCNDVRLLFLCNHAMSDDLSTVPTYKPHLLGNQVEQMVRYMLATHIIIKDPNDVISQNLLKRSGSTGLKDQTDQRNMIHSNGNFGTESHAKRVMDEDLYLNDSTYDYDASLDSIDSDADSDMIEYMRGSMLPANKLPKSVKGHVTIVLPWICQWYAKEFYRDLTEHCGQEFFECSEVLEPSYSIISTVDHIRQGSCYIMEDSARPSNLEEDERSAAIHALMGTKMSSKRRGILNMLRKLVPYTSGMVEEGINQILTGVLTDFAVTYTQFKFDVCMLMQHTDEDFEL